MHDQYVSRAENLIPMFLDGLQTAEFSCAFHNNASLQPVMEKPTNASTHNIIENVSETR